MPKPFFAWTLTWGYVTAAVKEVTSSARDTAVLGVEGAGGGARKGGGFGGGGEGAAVVEIGGEGGGGRMMMTMICRK